MYHIKLDQLEALGIKNVVVFDDCSSSAEIAQNFAKYKKENLSSVSLTILDKEF